LYPERDYGRDDRKKRLWRECKTKIFSIFNHFSSLAELGICSPCGSRGSISDLYFFWGKACRYHLIPSHPDIPYFLFWQ